MNVPDTGAPIDVTGRARFFSRHGDRGQYADIKGTGGINGFYSQDLDALTAGQRVGLHDSQVCVSVVGVIRTVEHTDAVHVFTFEESGFRVLVGEEPVTARWQSWQWTSPRAADHVHAVVRGTDCRSGGEFPALTGRYRPEPGRSLAVVDMTGSGDTAQMWRFGTPYRSDLGALLPWCLHCGSGDFAVRCRAGYAHRPVAIWTPFGFACAEPPQNLPATSDLRDRDGLPPLDPFDATAMDQAVTYYLSDSEEWFDSNMFGLQDVVPPEVYDRVADRDEEDSTAP